MRTSHSLYGKSVHCAAHVAACQELIQRNIQAHPPSSASEPWDVDDEDTSVVCLDNSCLPTANSVRDETCDDVSMTCADMKGKCRRTTRDESLG